MSSETHRDLPPLNPELEKALPGRGCRFNDAPGIRGDVHCKTLRGTIERAQYLGRTVVGNIPDYMLSIRGGLSGTVREGISMADHKVSAPA